MERESGVQDNFRHRNRMNTVRDLLPIALLLVLWWIGLWGFLDTLLGMVIKNNTTTALFVYGSIVLVVLFIVTMKPQMLEHFV